MGADSVRQSVVNRSDFNLALEDPETALDVCHGPLPLDYGAGIDVIEARHEQQLAIQTLGSCQRTIINAPLNRNHPRSTLTMVLIRLSSTALWHR